MPHVIVKLYAGKSAEQKAVIADAVTMAIMASAGSSADAVSVAIEDVAPTDWVDAVYKPDIVAKAATLFKKPGYNPL
ncbi:4-oxalocrotonate tautomerase [Methylobacterium sp. BTF04]|nr:tautomerase family protein [Methylobacterium sp. BTF04]NEU13368.1 4-oxalocrotonate tautomerase [Methylobacterium sp. BTF04]